MDHSRTILVDGATGYLGNHVVHELLLRQSNVRCLVHPGAGSEDIEFLRSMGAQIYTGDLVGINSEVDSAFNNVDTVIHLIGTIAPKRGEKLSVLHKEQTAALVERATKYGVKKIVMVSALGANPQAPSIYHRTKWQAEEEILHSNLPAVILRPSLIIGRTVGRRNSKLVARFTNMITTRKKVPLIAGGHNKIQPVYIGDLVKAILQCVDNNDICGNRFELGGPDVITMKQFVEALMHMLQIRKSFLTIPAPIAMIAGLVSELVEKVPTVSRDQVTLSLSDNICSENALETVFHIMPIKVSDALKSYRAPENSNLTQARK